MRVNKESLGFGWLVGEKKQFENVTLGSGKFFTINQLIRKIKCHSIINKYSCCSPSNFIIWFNDIKSYNTYSLHVNLLHNYLFFHHVVLTVCLSFWITCIQALCKLFHFVQFSSCNVILSSERKQPEGNGCAEIQTLFRWVFSMT